MFEKRIPHLSEAASEEASSSTTIDSSQKSRERVAHKYSTFSYGCSLPLFVLFLLSFALLGCLLHSSLYHQLDPKGCMMTYMQPTYYRILGFDKDYTNLAGKYGLLLYRDEGDEHPALHPSQLTQTDDRDWSIAKSAKIRPSGVPALFIPGNAGSARQVRSIAKEATRYYNEKIQKGLRAPWSKPIDFFTVDFNEEFSAFHGQLLLDQSRYVNEAIAYILSLYSHSNTAFPRPTSVLIIGHSMGGIVARTLFTMDNFIPGSINTILTIASPHMVPPLALDYTVTSIYDKIEEFWIRGYDAPHGMLVNVSLVSIMGGNQDITVNSDAGNIHHIVPQSHGFSVFTSSIPHAWVGSDHLSILWCNQVVKQIGIALVEVIDANTPNQVKPLDERMKIFRNHLLWEDSQSTSSISKDNEMVDLSGVSHSFEEGNIWVSPTRKPVTVTQQTSKAHYHILTIPKHKDLDTLTLLTNLRFGSQEDFSLLLCKDKPQQGSDDKTLTCESDSLSLTAIPGSTRGSTMPLFTGEYFTGQEFRFMSVALKDLGGFRYVVILNKRSVYTGSSFVIVEFKNEASTTEVVHTTAIGLLRSGLTRNKFPENPSLVSTIRLPNVDNSILAYKLEVHGGSCAGANMERFAPMIRQSSWAINEDKFSVNVANKENGIDINFHGDLPYYDKVLLRAINGIELMFWRDPTCKEPLSFTLTIDTYGSLGKVVIRYRTIVLVFTFMVVILTIRAQIKDWCRNESFKPFGVVLSSLLRTTFWKLSLLLVFVSFIQSLMSKNIVILSPEAMADSILIKSRSWISRAWFDNALLGRNETFFWLLLPIFLHVSVGMVAFVWFSLGTIVRAISFFTRLLNRNTSTQHNNGVKSRAIVIGTFMLIATAVPYQLVFAMTVIALIVISAKKLAVAQSTTEIAYTQAAWDRFHFSMSILVMFFFLLPFTVPSLMVWIRNIAGGWLHSFPSDHRVDYVGPFIVFVEGIANAAAVTRMTWKRYLTPTIWMLDGILVYLVLFGARYSWQIYFLTRLWVSWLVILFLVETGIGRKIESQIRHVVVPDMKKQE